MTKGNTKYHIYTNITKGNTNYHIYTNMTKRYYQLSHIY